MAAAAAGARSAGGFAIGILSGPDRSGAAGDLAAVVVTGMGQARNAIIINSADAVIVVGGSWGTLSELALGLRRGLPVIALGGWRVIDGAGTEVAGQLYADSPGAAVDLAMRS
jgi:uncharacterized protein (TIGR00725 family)